jgi:uncharacterized protein YggE
MVFMALIISACGTAYAQGSESTPIRTVSVAGSGQVFLTPDIAYITIGVRTEGEDAAKSVASNNSQAKKVEEEIESLGVDEKDIQTTNFNIHPMHEYDEMGNIRGTIYVVENTIRVTMRDLDMIGELLSAAVESGANFIHGIQFDVADKSEALSEAREAAVESAQAQAEELAQAAGVNLGRVESITTYGGYPTPLYEGIGGGAPRSVAAEVPISPGQLSISVEVNMVYEIR